MNALTRTKLSAVLAFALIVLLLDVSGATAHPSALDSLTSGQTPPKKAKRYEMVLIHGLGGAAAIWDEITPYLKGTFKVYAFELSGHGRTQPVDQPSIETEVARLTAFIADNDIEYPTLVGHGLGGQLALRYALDYPADTHRLIMIDTAPRQLATEEMKHQTVEAMTENYDRFVAGRYLRMSPREHVTDTIVDHALKTDSASFISLLLSSFEFDTTEELGMLSVPLLVIGSHMMFPAPESCQVILDEIGFSQARSLSFKRIEDTGHYVMLERPVYVASVLMAFGVTADHMFETGY